MTIFIIKMSSTYSGNVSFTSHLFLTFECFKALCLYVDDTTRVSFMIFRASEKIKASSERKVTRVTKFWAGAVWQEVWIKLANLLQTLTQKVAKAVFLLKTQFFSSAVPKVPKYLGYFCKKFVCKGNSTIWTHWTGHGLTNGTSLTPLSQ